METKEQLQKQIEDLQKQIESLDTDFQTIKYKGKEFMVCKWEAKPFKDFPMPKGFDIADYKDVIDLVNDDKLIFSKPYAEIYICKNPFKRNKIYGLSRLYLDVVLNLYSYYSGFDYSDSNGRVVICKK